MYDLNDVEWSFDWIFVTVINVGFRCCYLHHSTLLSQAIGNRGGSTQKKKKNAIGEGTGRANNSSFYFQYTLSILMVSAKKKEKK